MSQLIWAVCNGPVGFGMDLDAIGGWDGCTGCVSFCLLSAMETCCRVNASGRHPCGTS